MNFNVELAKAGIKKPLNNLGTVLSSFYSTIGSAKNKATFAAAITAQSCKVAMVGHSVMFGGNQNFYGATVYNLLRNALKTAFPETVFTFNNFAIGGTSAGQFVTTHPAITIGAISNLTYRESFEATTTSLALTTNSSWRNAVAAYQPDLLFIQFDLNETSYQTFATNLQAIIDDVNTNAAWSAKRPTMVLITSHVGVTNGAITTAIVRNCHKVIRSMASKNKIALIDAGRVYDILTLATDPYNITPAVTGELNQLGRMIANTVLPSTDYDSKIGTAYWTSALTLREQSSGSALRFYRKVSTVNGAAQCNVTTNTASTTPSLFYRADPLDANYATGTGRQYELRITGTTVQVYYWVAGSAVAVTAAITTLTNGVGVNTVFTMRAEFADAKHKITIIAPNNELKTFEFIDFQNLDGGYIGFGYGGSSGGWFNSGAIGSLSSGFVLEFWNSLPVGSAAYHDSDLLNTTNDWSSNPNSLGGNGVNHLTNLGYKVIYEPAIVNCLHQLQV